MAAGLAEDARLALRTGKMWLSESRPLQYLRWYIDGVLLYEVNKQALVAQTNGTGELGSAPPAGCDTRVPAATERSSPVSLFPSAPGASVGQRLIPLEPMYIIFNLGMSESFGKIQYDKLSFPAQMKIDWVRCAASRLNGPGQVPHDVLFDCKYRHCRVITPFRGSLQCHYASRIQDHPHLPPAAGCINAQTQ